MVVGSWHSDGQFELQSLVLWWVTFSYKTSEVFTGVMMVVCIYIYIDAVEPKKILTGKYICLSILGFRYYFLNKQKCSLRRKYHVAHWIMLSRCLFQESPTTRITYRYFTVTFCPRIFSIFHYHNFFSLIRGTMGVFWGLTIFPYSSCNLYTTEYVCKFICD